MRENIQFSKEEIREGLETTLSNLEEGWSGYVLEYGNGGCLVQNMPGATKAHDHDNQDVTKQALRQELVKALGFSNTYYDMDGKPHQFSNHSDMYTWNDDPARSYGEVKDRVKDAIKAIIDAG